MTMTTDEAETTTSTVATDDDGEPIDVGSFVVDPTPKPEGVDVQRPTEPTPAEPEVASELDEVDPHTEARALAAIDEEPPADLAPMPGGDEMNTMLTMARVLADSALVPRDLRKKPHDVFLVLLTGRELGIAPTAALRSCYVVDGRVTLAPALKQAIVTDRGLGKVRPAPGNNAERATWRAYETDGRGGWLLAGELTVTMTEMEVAQNGNKGRLIDKDNWQSYPARMLSARCRGWLIDDIWPEAAFGLYSPDEVGAFTDENGEPIDVASYEHVPEAYRQAAPPPPEVIGPDEVAAMTARIDALPADAEAELRSKWKQAKFQGGPVGKLEPGMPAGAYRMAAAVLSGVESMVRAGRFGEDAQAEAKAADAGEPVDEVAVGVCADCDLDPCQCPGPDDDEEGDDPATAQVVYAEGEEPFDVPAEDSPPPE